MQSNPAQKAQVPTAAEAILESITDAFFAVGEDWRFHYVNRQAEAILGRERNDLLGKNLWEEFPGLVGSEFEKVYRLVASQRVTGSVTSYYPDHHCWYDVRVFPAPDGISIYFRDASERVGAAAALAKSEARYRRLFEAIDEGFCIVKVLFDEAGRAVDYIFLETNTVFAEQTGLRQAEGKRMRELKADHEQIWFETYGKVALTGEPIRFESQAKALNRWYDVYAFRIDDPQDHHVAILFRDISSRKRHEEELRQAARRKDEFLAMLAHELRNPLAPIGAGAELLKTGRLDQRRLEQTSAIIGRQVKHMTSLVDDLLDVSRVTRGLVTLEQKPVDLKEVADHAVEQVRPLIESRAHRMTVRAPAGPLFVCGDKVRLVQTVANLLSNAAKYTPRQGEIVLRLEAGPDDVTLGVQDNGIGIAPEMLGEVFELFAQGARSPDRSQGGLGLGLALVKSLVELHGGSVAAASEGLGKGSLFTMRLPRIDLPDTQGGGRQADAAGLKPGERLRVMVVDDNRDAALTLCELLEAYDYAVTVAHDGQQALYLAAEQPPQAFILDIGLPDMDGYTLAQRLQESPRTRDAAFIALTGYGPGQSGESIGARIDHHLMKPVSITRLTELLEALKPA